MNSRFTRRFSRISHHRRLPLAAILLVATLVQLIPSVKVLAAEPSAPPPVQRAGTTIGGPFTLPEGGPSTTEAVLPKDAPSKFPAADAQEIVRPKLDQIPLKPADGVLPIDRNNPVAVALADAQRSGKKVEVLNQRSEISTTWANPDGSLTTEVSAGPVRVEKGKELVPVDTSLFVEGGSVVTKATAGNLELSGGGPAGSELASLSSGDKRVVMRWNQALPAPVLEGNKATYRDVAPGQDLVVEANTTGFETFLILKERPQAAPVVTIPVELEGLTMARTPEGHLSFADAQGRPSISSSAPFMFSAAQDSKTMSRTQFRMVDSRLQPSATGATELVLTPDPAFLNDPATVFPVTIDPGVQLTSALDAYVDSANSNTNYDSSADLKIGGGSTKYRSFLRFDTGAIKGKSVSSATLDLYQNWAYSCTTAPTTVDGAGAFGPGITWNNQPAMENRPWYEQVPSGTNSGCSGQPAAWKNLSITGLVQQWATNGFNGPDYLVVRATDETNVAHSKTFASANSASPPKISINYMDASLATAPQAVSAVPGNNQATITWDRPSFPGNPLPDSYSAFVYTYPALGFVGQWNVCGNCLSAVVGNNLTNGVQYIAAVYAHNSTGFGAAGLSNVFVPTGVPAAPRNVVANAGNGTATIRWSHPVNNGAVIDGYLITASSAPGVVNASMAVSANTTDLLFNQPLTNGVAYNFAVWSHSAAGYGAYMISNLTYVGANDPLTGAGDRSRFSYDSYALNDRTTAQVNIGTGNLQVSVTDLVLPGVFGQMPVGRTYNSLAASPSAPGVSAWYSTMFGYDWRFNLSPDVRLVPYNGGNVAFHSPSGNVAMFTPAGGSSYNPPQGLDVDLTKEADLSYKMVDHATQQVLRFNPAGDLTSDTDRFGNAVNYDLSQNGGRKPLSITSTAGTSPGNKVDIDYSAPGGKVAWIKNPASSQVDERKVEFNYDSAGLGLTSVKDAAGNTTFYGYDRVSNLVEINMPDGRITQFTYDSKHRVTSVIRKLAGQPDVVTKYDHTTTPGHTKVTDPRNNPPVDYEIDSSGRVTGVTDAFGRSSQTVWQAKDRVDYTINPRNKTAQLSWEQNDGESLTGVLDEAGVVTATNFNISGAKKYLPSTAADARQMPQAQSWTAFDYSTKGRLNDVTRSSARAISVINDDGTVQSAATPENVWTVNGVVQSNSSKFVYENHLLKSVTPPDKTITNPMKPAQPVPANQLGVESYLRDGAGRVKTYTGSNGVVTTYTYDPMDRVTGMSFSNATPPVSSISMGYDASGNMISRSDGQGTTSYSFDTLSRMTLKDPPGGPELNLEYGYDAASNLTSSKDQGGTTQYVYNKANELEKLIEPPQGILPGRTSLFAYNNLGLRSDTWHNTTGGGPDSNGVMTPPAGFALHSKQLYDDAGKLIQITATHASSDVDRLSDLVYDYTVPNPTDCPGAQPGKKTDQLQKVTDQLTGKVTTYCYNIMGNLTKAATTGGPTYTYDWDLNSNRKSDENGTHQFDLWDQLADTGYVYDSAGNQTSTPSQQLTAQYNGINQTLSITKTGQAALPMGYAAFGQSERTSAGSTTAQNGALGVQTETTGGQTTPYVREPSGKLVMEQTSIGDFYFMFDGLGSVIGLVDAVGVQRAAYSYDPFGAHATETALGGVLPPNPWRWMSGYLDSTGLYHFGERYYDPAVGRFLQVDPINGGSCNAYDYACGDPLNRSDTTGTCSILTRACRERIAKAFRHLDISVGGCVLRCFFIGQQGGYVYYQSGRGCCGAGFSIGWANKPYEERSCNSLSVFAGKGAVGLAAEVGMDAEYRPTDSTISYSPGLQAGIAILQTHDLSNVWSAPPSCA